ncbi:rhamnogalacturonan acetylesterase [Colwellia sp. MB02u-18]|uniref:rhamnogalacturonan acetylesterase n=1 Tax=unclassified Colwellia TaxID=196834 RepID=UPI0015F4E8DF|nr:MULTISPECIES: rhamnogalacturonan acetylesterase [unclassified Colwellia]MBA6225370.1 rhamnogalacturonan acetylesterase [Colwellia sp. MB3u-45]MBA6267180.1 rhamnogalacturonan acetylesterase [Colwellia sp. MB3u-43]MBA6322792.1 rhamnogalacturonan acetylesterase [Colwellia sp. MB02u-19]MBA6324800.1 rhamnogalacturonan acetylesterase [Colwellia sp. MB02u-18]MBA6331009.1 rhamnogalacturonan acetylesterase [Colwellia sp. MB02u-12]
MYNFIIFVASLCCTFATNASEVTQIFMAGDSTMSIKEVKDYPETGWGMPFSYFFNESVIVENRAKNGRSTKSFIAEGRWQKILVELKPDDYVIIEFGHNDQSKYKVDRYTPPHEFSANLTLFIMDVRAKKAHVILMTPITRRYFDENGTIKDTHPVYADLVRDVAKDTQVVFIDMEKITQQYFQQLGDENSALRFMHILPNLHPNYPHGVKDNTHLNQLGAREVAQLVLTELKEIDHPLYDKLRAVDSKHLKLSYYH